MGLISYSAPPRNAGGLYKGIHDASKSYPADCTVSFQGGTFMALTARPANHPDPIADPANWQSASNALVSVTAVPPQGVAHINHPLFMRDTVLKKTYELQVAVVPPIYSEI